MSKNEGCAVQPDADNAEGSELNCMEVRGGNGTANDHFVRPGLDVWIASRSQGGDVAGGSDLHLVSSCASGRITRMLLADICGCGTAYTEITNKLRELMKRNVNSIQQVGFVRDMSRRLAEASYRGVFASTLISTYFAPTRSFTFCNAGHPPPLLFRARAGAWSALKQDLAEASMGDSPGRDSPLGVIDSGEYQQSKTKLNVGDMVLAYSNTLTECRGDDGQLLGVGGLLSRVRDLDAQHPSRLIANLLDQIESEHAENLAAEDATLLLCLATKRPVGWRDNLLAPLRLLRAASDALPYANKPDERGKQSTVV